MIISHAQLCSINSLNSDGIISENDSLGLKQKELFFFFAKSWQDPKKVSKKNAKKVAKI